MVASEYGDSVVSESVCIAAPNASDWAYLLPAWSIILVLFIYVGFVLYNIFETPSLHDLKLVVGMLITV